MKYPYALISDTHCHGWTAFSTITVDGINSRLQIILDEIARAYRTLHGHGGDQLFHAGDLFHTRGEIKPSVFNPTMQAFTNAAATYPGVSTWALPGNHDLEDVDATFLGNAMQALSEIEGFAACLEPTIVGDVVVFPWFARLDDLRAAMKAFADPKKDAIIHAPVNGVLKGIPNHGLEAAELAAMGFRRVFAGHYHNHAVMEGGKVVSIGATTHQTWSDPGTKAGFIIVWEDRIEHVETTAPKFVEVDLSSIDSEADLAAQVCGNFAKLTLVDAEPKELIRWRDDLTTAGAKGRIVLNQPKAKGATRVTRPADGKSLSLGASVEQYIKQDFKTAFPDEVSKAAQEILSEVIA